MSLVGGRVGLCVLLMVATVAPCAVGQLNLGTPKPLQEVGIDQHLDAKLPLDAKFTDDRGRDVRLGDYFDGRRPVLLTLTYNNCPGLCTLVLNSVVTTLKDMTWTPGKEFVLLTISFDPLEEPKLAALKKQNYVNDYGRSEARDGWHFLTSYGRKDEIQRVTEAVGFRYRWDDSTAQWAHPATLIVCTPDGRVSRYLGGINDDPAVVRLSMVEASDGKVGSLWDRVFLSCFHYVATEGRYSPVAWKLLRVAAAATVFGLGVLIFTLWRREVVRRRAMLRGRAAASLGA